MYDLEPTLKRLAAFEEPEATLDWATYDAEAVDGATEADLIRILALYADDLLSVEDPQRLAIHAWRLLARRGTARCVTQLVSSLAAACEDEWVLEELPAALARFGGAGIPELQRYLLDEPVFATDVHATVGLVGALELIAREHEDQRFNVCRILREKLRGGLDNPPDLNAFLIYSLLTLQDKESLPDITAAFAHDVVTTDIVDWDSVHRELGAAREPPVRNAPQTGVPDFAGDVTMDKLLRAAGSHVACPELRCLLLGSILAVETVRPSRLFEIVMQDHAGKAIEFSTEGQARRVFGQVMALWNEMSQFQDRSFELPPLPAEPGDLGDWDFQIVRALFQRLHVQAFLDGFAMGSANVREAALWREFTDELHRRLDGIAGLAKPDHRATAVEIAHSISDLREYWAGHYPRFAASCTAVRLERVRKQQMLAAHGRVGRNDPCPCGSGKKFKFCCLV